MTLPIMITELQDNYRTSMNAYLEEVQKTHIMAIKRDTNFSSQLEKEEKPKNGIERPNRLSSAAADKSSTAISGARRSWSVAGPL